MVVGPISALPCARWHLRQMTSGPLRCAPASMTAPGPTMTGPDVHVYCGRFDVRCGADQKRAEWTKNESVGGEALKGWRDHSILQGLYIEVDSVAKQSKQLIGIAKQVCWRDASTRKTMAVSVSIKAARHLSLAPVSHRALVPRAGRRMLRRHPPCIDFEFAVSGLSRQEGSINASVPAA